MTRTYTHLGLNRWPFPVVPEPDYCTFLAARSQVRMDVHEMVDALARRDTSSIQLFWAWFGAGKTHTVHYLSHYAAQAANAKGNNRLITVYTEFPKGAKSPVTSRLGAEAQIEIRSLLDADVGKFIKGVIEFVRDPASDLLGLITNAQAATSEQVGQDFFPFTDDAIEALKSHLMQMMTPREITIKMTRAMGRAFRLDKPVITADCLH